MLQPLIHGLRTPRTIAYSETYKTAQGRKLRIRQKFHYKHKRPRSDFGKYLHYHKPFTYFSYLLPDNVPKPKQILKTDLHHHLLSTDPDIRLMAQADLAEHYRQVKREDQEALHASKVVPDYDRLNQENRYGNLNPSGTLLIRSLETIQKVGSR